MHWGVKNEEKKLNAFCSILKVLRCRYAAELHYYYTKYIRTNKNNKSKRNTLVQIDLITVISGFKYKLKKNFAITNRSRHWKWRRSIDYMRFKKKTEMVRDSGETVTIGEQL